MSDLDYALLPPVPFPGSIEDQYPFDGEMATDVVASVEAVTSVKDAAHSLAVKLAYPPWLACIGSAGEQVGYPVILLMLNRKLYRFEEKKLPKEWEGFPVQTEVTGPMRML